MPRRIIYIKNPSSGSNFRTINGSGGSSRPSKPKKGKPYRPKAPKLPKDDPTNNTGQANGYLPGYKPPKNWFIHTPVEAAINYGSYSGPGLVGPTTLQFTEFQPSETLAGDIYLIAMGIDPATGDQLAPLGTPGQLKYFYGGPSFDLTAEQIGRDAGSASLTFGGPFAEIPSGYTGMNPNRNDQRPWWAK